MNKEKSKKIVVKRETRTNHDSEPSRVYKPRTLKARPVTDSGNSSESESQLEYQEPKSYKSERSEENSSKKRSSEKVDPDYDNSRETKSASKKFKDSSESRSSYKPRTGSFKKSNEDFLSSMESNEDNSSEISFDEPTKRKTLRVQKSEEKPFPKREKRTESDRYENRGTSRSVAGKPTGYRSSFEGKPSSKPLRESKEEREERFRKQRSVDLKKTKFGGKPERNERTFGSRHESPKKQQLKLYIPKEREKKFIDKPIPKPKREYDDKPFLDVDNDGLIRLNKFISNTGLCSRREADAFIENGMITVNGAVVTQLGTKVDPNSEICFKGKKLETEHKVYILLNKPKDYITTVDDPHAKKTVMELIEGACTERVYPVGRLDRNSTGLLLLTNDGEMTKRLTHPSFQKKKIYHVGLERVLVREDMEKILSGVEIEGELVKADAIEYTENSDGSEIGIEIHTGQNRVVRNMFDVLGYKVIKLDRVYFAGLTKKNLPRGSWRFLSQQEINMLKTNRFD